MFRHPFVRRLQWRVGRRLYAEARGEPRGNSIAVNGETYVQKAVIDATLPLDVLTVLDVGANQGDWAKPFLAALPPERLSPDRLQVLLFEPVPETRARLLQTLSDCRGGDLAHVEDCALSDRAGTMPMAVLSETGGTNTLSFDHDLERGALRMIEVETLTLAEFCDSRGLANLHLIKCDTEGHDLSVLGGALPLLQAGRIDVLQFEYNHRWVYARAFLKDVFGLIDGLPYSFARLRPQSIEVIARWHPELERFFEANFLLVRTPALEWFRVHWGAFDESNTYA